MDMTLDQDALDAAIDLVGRTGAQEIQIGFLHEGVPVKEAGWFAHAQYRGVRITVEDHRGPVEAAEALARRLLTGAKCTHCGGLVALRDDGAVAYPGHLIDGSPWDEATIRAAGQCRYRRMGARWVRGCEGRQAKPEPPPRRAKKPKRRKGKRG